MKQSKGQCALCKVDVDGNPGMVICRDCTTKLPPVLVAAPDMLRLLELIRRLKAREIGTATVDLIDEVINKARGAQ